MTAQTYTDAQKLFALDALCAAGDVSAERLAQAVAIYDTCQAARSVVVSDEDVRAKFEAWAEADGFRLTRRDATGSTRFGQYCDASTQVAWEAWHEAATTFAQSHGVAGAVKVPNELLQHTVRALDDVDTEMRATGRSTERFSRLSNAFRPFIGAAMHEDREAANGKFPEHKWFVITGVNREEDPIRLFTSRTFAEEYCARNPRSDGYSIYAAIDAATQEKAS